MKKIILSLSLIHSLYAANFVVDSTSNISNTYSGLMNKKDLAGVYAKPATIDKTTTFEGWSENIVQNSTFDGTDNWDLLDGSGFKAEINNGVNRDDNPFMFGDGNIFSKANFEIGQDKYVKAMPYMKYINFTYTKSGKQKKDYFQIYLDVYDKDDNLLQTVNSPKIKGNNYVWRTNTLLKTMGISNDDAKTIYQYVVRVKETVKKDSDGDAFLDDLSINLLSNFFYADDTNINEKVIYPTVYPHIDVLGQNGHNYMVPDDLEDWAEDLDITTSDIGDYVVLSVGLNDYIWGGDGDDTLVGYQGNQISDTQRLYSYGGDDKLYMPAYGSGHYAIGGNGWDTVVFRGKKSDYTIDMNASGEIDDYDISSDNMSARVYECEQICFTEHNPLNEPDGNVQPSDMDCYVFKNDGSNNIVKTNVPETVDSKTTTDYVILHRTQINSIDIKSNIDITDPINIHITNLPKDVKSFTDNNGTVTNVNSYQNEDGEDRNTIKLQINGSGTTTFNFTVDSYDSSTDMPDMSNIKITRSFD